MKKKYLILSGLAFCALTLNAQQLKEGYIEWGQTGTNFTLKDWSKGQKYSEDDNFFISRVKPKKRFRNTATQVNTGLDELSDKQLIYWVPINKPPFNALPDGVFDSEVFPMWSYVTHYGNWTASLVRIPGSFTDVAHKNGVGTSVVASVPYGGLAASWESAMTRMVSEGSEKMGDYMQYYGIDGLGYNSEFSTGNRTLLTNLRTFHEDLVRRFKTSGLNPVFENFWYDGTNDAGSISFDRGLGSHNQQTFGDGEHSRTSLFFNYNWNRIDIDASINKAKEMGRSPLDLYCGVNMQGGEPRGQSWPLLVGKNISIGLWGAHSMNMPFESRGEKGALPEVQQRTYMLRVERYFTGGTRNPVNTPAVSSLMGNGADNFDFFGMSKFMSARSSLKWDLSTEPFITYFNLGNGKFFNWNGERQSDREWYNIGIQDYLPTWRWWFANKFLGRTPGDVPQSGLSAEFVWDDAWMGGSLMRIFGSSSDEYLHLFKTEFGLKANDEITIRYKVMSGSSDMTLALSAKGTESTVLAENSLQVIQKESVEIGEWVKKTFTIRGGLNALNGKDLAVIALHFKNASNLNLYLGELSITRGTSDKPATPVIEKSVVLAANYKGVDGKIIFNMPNNKGNEVCYNLDVKTSLFKLYAQQKGKSPVLIGATTSWAGMYFAVPVEFKADDQEIRFGVSAVSLDMKSESDIAWDEYKAISSYQINDDIVLNKTTIKPGEDFEISYIDAQHEVASWKILNENGEMVKEATDLTTFSVPEGLQDVGNYTLELTGKEYDKEGNRVETTRTFVAYIQITDKSVGALPKIMTLTANDEDADIKTAIATPVSLKYTGREANGSGSQGVEMAEKAFGFKAGDMKLEAHKSFSIAFWVKYDKIVDENHALVIRDAKEGWPMNNWGWLWGNIDSKGMLKAIYFRGSGNPQNAKGLEYYFDNARIAAGVWVHFAYVFEFEGTNMHFVLYINGKKQTVSSYKHPDIANGAMQEGEPGFLSRSGYGLRAAHVISVSSTDAGGKGIVGVVDNLECWNKALTAEDVKIAMGDIDKTKLPEGLTGFWSLENKAGDDFTFANEGSLEGVKAGLHEYTSGGAEGEGNFKWVSCTYAPGSPFISGTAYQVVTTPKWSIDKGDITDVTGEDVAGSANVKFAKDGVYTATLTLENGWGADSKTFSYITVGGGSGFESVDLATELSAYPNPFIDHVNVRFSKEGTYAVRIYDMNGNLVGEKVQNVATGEIMRIGVNVSSGTYVVQVLSDGKLVRAVKLLKR